MKNDIMLQTCLSILLLLTVFSWFLFPILLKFLAPLAFRVGFILILSIAAIINFKYGVANQLEFSKEHKVFFLLWGGYLLALMVATIGANDLYAYKQLLSTMLKVLFFAFLLFYIDSVYIYKIFSIYANLMTLVVIIAAIVAIGVGMGVLDPVMTFRNHMDIETYYNFDVYWGSFYGLSPLSAPFPLFRLQGLAEEPGTFAFSLMPALFWMLYVKKAMLRSAILSVGILGTLSLGVGALLLVVAPLIVKLRTKFTASSFFILVLLALILCFSLVPTLTGEPIYYWLVNVFSVSCPLVDCPLVNSENAKIASLSFRVEAIIKVLNYLAYHPFGTGVGLGMTTVDYAIAVGFANAALESGVMGGVFYIIMFLSLAWMVCDRIWQITDFSVDDKMLIAIGLSVLTCIVMGLQRQQPDLSFWHMWIYASFLYLTLKTKRKDVSAEVI